MQRVAFQLRIRPGKIEEYDEAHKDVWPELIQELERLGASEYSIFRQDTQLFLYLHVPDWDTFQEAINNSEVNQRWQKAMAPIFEAGGDLMSGKSPKLMQEVFYMRGKNKQEK